MNHYELLSEVWCQFLSSFGLKKEKWNKMGNIVNQSVILIKKACIQKYWTTWRVSNLRDTVSLEGVIIFLTAGRVQLTFTLKILVPGVGLHRYSRQIAVHSALLPRWSDIRPLWSRSCGSLLLLYYFSSWQYMLTWEWLQKERAISIS